MVNILSLMIFVNDIDVPLELLSSIQLLPNTTVLLKLTLITGAFETLTAFLRGIMDVIRGKTCTVNIFI